MATAPFELMVGPLEVYTGPVNEARPDLNDAPAGNWTLLGTSGSKNYAEDGVTVTPEETIEEWFALGSTGPQKAFRTQERIDISVTLHDMTAEHLATLFNGVSVTDTAPGTGAAGVRDFDLLQGATVNELAILLRSNQSPYLDGGKSQWWIPRAYVMEIGEITYEKGVPAGAEITIAVLEHSSNGFGKYEAQDAAAL